MIRLFLAYSQFMTFTVEGKDLCYFVQYLIVNSYVFFILWLLRILELCCLWACWGCSNKSYMVWNRYGRFWWFHRVCFLEMSYHTVIVCYNIFLHSVCLLQLYSSLSEKLLILEWRAEASSKKRENTDFCPRIHWIYFKRERHHFKSVILQNKKTKSKGHQGENLIHIIIIAILLNKKCTVWSSIIHHLHCPFYHKRFLRHSKWH